MELLVFVISIVVRAFEERDGIFMLRGFVRDNVIFLRSYSSRKHRIYAFLFDFRLVIVPIFEENDRPNICARKSFSPDTFRLQLAVLRNWRNICTFEESEGIILLVFFRFLKYLN